jgi:hypothetical protein
MTGWNCLEQVLLDTIESSTVFVQSFRARLWDLTDRALRHRADRFMTALRSHGEAFHDRYYYLAAFTKSVFVWFLVFLFVFFVFGPGGD